MARRALRSFGEGGLKGYGELRHPFQDALRLAAGKLHYQAAEGPQSIAPFSLHLMSSHPFGARGIGCVDAGDIRLEVQDGGIGKGIDVIYLNHVFSDRDYPAQAQSNKIWADRRPRGKDPCKGVLLVAVGMYLQEREKNHRARKALPDNACPE
jgi:hypothetical protein